MTTTPVTHRFPLTRPVNLSVRVGQGSVEIRTADDLAEAVVELTPAPGTEDLLARMTVELDGPTLVVHQPRQGGLSDLLAPWRSRWSEGIAIVITVPTGTALKVATFTAPVTVHGRCGGADITSATGRITLDTVDGDLVVRYGSTDSSVQRVTGNATVRSGSGSAHFGEVLGDLTCGCGSGRLDVGESHGSVKLRAGSGSATLSSVWGDVDLASGSGTVSIGLPTGITAKLDVTTGSGTVRTDMPIEDAPADRKGSITVRARTGSGEIRLFRAA